MPAGYPNNLVSDPSLDWIIGPRGSIGMDQVIFICDINTEGLSLDLDLLVVTFKIEENVMKTVMDVKFSEFPVQLAGDEFGVDGNNETKLGYMNTVR